MKEELKKIIIFLNSQIRNNIVEKKASIKDDVSSFSKKEPKQFPEKIDYLREENSKNKNQKKDDIDFLL